MAEGAPVLRGRVRTCDTDGAVVEYREDVVAADCWATREYEIG